MERFERLILVCAALALVAQGARAGRDCLAPLEANAGWSCHAELSTGEAVDYCTELTHAFGDDPASRFFHMNVTGPYPRTCTCGAKGRPPGADFGEDATYLCLDRATDTVETGRISRKKITGQTFNVIANVRSTFTCRVDPACDVETVIDPDLPPEQDPLTVASGQDVKEDVRAGGDVGVGYLPGCAGFTTEAPTVTFDFTGPASGVVLFYYEPDTLADLPEAVVVAAPSGELRCETDQALYWDDPAPGLYRVWVAVESAGTEFNGSVRASASQ
jgi:hypothetical protein